MTGTADHHRLSAQADALVGDILKAASSWAREVPTELTLPIRAVCVRLAEMVADQRHYLAPLPEPQETERQQVLTMVAERLRSPAVVQGIAPHLEQLAQRELRVTGSWALAANSQTEWITTAIQYLEECCGELEESVQPDAYWGDDVVGGIVVSVKAIIGTDDLHARIESQYAGGGRPPVDPDR